MTNPTKLAIAEDVRLSTIRDTLSALATVLDMDVTAAETDGILDRLTQYTAGQLGVSSYAVKPRKAKLTWDKVDSIRENYAAGNMTMTELAETNGVTYSTISRVVTNKMWIKK